MEPVRLQKFLADAGVCSRRAGEAMIEAGEVRVNGVPAELGQKVTPGVDRVSVRGRLVGGALASPTAKITLVVNKPRGAVCGVPDGRHPTTVFDFIPKPLAKHRFLVIGRLAPDTEGLVVLTSDGALADRLARASSKVVRRFVVTLEEPMGRGRFPLLTRGVKVGEEGEMERVDKIFALDPNSEGASRTLEVHITHGRGRGLHQLFAAIGCDVVRTQCVQFGDFRLKGIPLRGARPLSKDETEALFATED